MANKILLTPMDDTPKQICFRDSTDFAPTVSLIAEGLTPTYGQLDMTSVANTNARASAKVDLGANFAQSYRVRGAFELAATPTAGNVIELYWAESAHSTAATGNPAGLTGSDAAYTGVDSDLTRALMWLDFIGVHICTDDPTPVVQINGNIGTLTPGNRYGMLVIRDNSGASFHNDAVEVHVVLDPIIPEVQ